MTQRTLLLAALLPAVALANGYDVPNVNPRDLAMAGSLVSAQNDAAATYQNPSALSRLDGFNLSAAGSILGLTEKWSGTIPAQSGQTASTKPAPAPPVSLFAAYGFKVAERNAGVGLGLNVPAGGNVFFHDDWAGRGAIITVDRKVYAGYLTGGYEVLPRLRLGGGLIYYYTTEYLKQGVQPFDGAYGELTTKGGALSYDVSGEWTPFADLPLAIGIDYKHKATMTLKGDGHFQVPTILLATTADQGVTHVLTYPNMLHSGLSYRPMKELLLAFDYTFTRYSVYKEDLFQGDAGAQIQVIRNYGNGHTFRVGAEYDASPQLTLRLGALRDISGMDPAYYNPSLPDSNAWVASGGAGWKFNPDLSLNVGLFYAWLDKVTTTGSAPTQSFQGEFQTNVFIASVGLTWRTSLGGGGN